MAGEAFEESGQGMSDAAAAAALEGLFKGKVAAADPPAAAVIEDEDPPAAEQDDAPAGDDPSAQDDAAAKDDAPAADAPVDDEQDYEFRGKTYKLPKALVEGRMRLDDYRAKTEELANSRKAFVQQQKFVELQQHIQQAVAPDVAKIQNIDHQIARLKGNMPAPTADPVGYLELDKQVKDLEAVRESVRHAVLAKGTELLKQKQAAEAELLRAGQEQLAREIPNWKDQQVQADVVRHALESGFTVEELNARFDPRFLRVLHDAMQFRKSKAANPAALTQKRVAQAAPTVRPSATVNKAGARGQIAQLKDRATRSGSPDDAAAALTAMFRSAGRR